jgi:hypothetical protein
MAFIKFSALVSSVVGKLNGSYFQSQKGGTSLKNIGNRRSKAAASQRSLQIAQNRLGQVARSWGELSVSEVLAWNTFANGFERVNKNGIRYVPTGYQMYCEVNSNRLKLISPILNEPIVPAAPFDVNLCSIEMPTYDEMLFAAASPIPSGKIVVVSASAPTYGNKKYPPSGYKAILNVSSSETLPLDLYSAYSLVWGPGTGNAQYFWKFELIDIGSGISEGSKLTKADAG